LKTGNGDEDLGVACFGTKLAAILALVDVRATRNKPFLPFFIRLIASLTERRRFAFSDADLACSAFTDEGVRDMGGADACGKGLISFHTAQQIHYPGRQHSDQPMPTCLHFCLCRQKQATSGMSCGFISLLPS
jgi:hypothetical protein